MAIISSYPYDILIQDEDAWIGTDSHSRQTKQYTAQAISNYLNINGKVSVGGQIVYQFVTTPLDATGTFAFAAGGGDGTGFSAITSVKISVTEKSGQNVVPYVNYLVGDEILISAQDKVSEFGHYKVTSYTVDSTNNQFYTLGLEYIGGNGNIYVNKYYDIVNFTKPGAQSVTSVTGGTGITMSGTATQPVVNVDYVGTDNIIDIAQTLTSVDSFPYSPSILVNKSNPGATTPTVYQVSLSNISLDKFGAAAAAVSFGSQRISNLASPSLSTDGATKGYVDSVAGGLGTVTSITPGTGLDTVPSSAITTTGEIKLNYFTYINATPNGANTAASTDQIAFDRPGTPHRIYKTTLANVPMTALTSVKTYVDSVVSGGLIYQGGYNASTNSPDLTSSPNSIKKGWTYTVTADGTFFGEQLKIGDVIIAEVDTPSSLADWTTVQNNVDFATSGTDAAAVRGIAGFNSEDFTVSGTGFVSGNDATASVPGLARVTASDGIEVDSVTNGNFNISLTSTSGDNAFFAKAVLNSSVSNVSVSSAGGLTTYTVTITNGFFGTNVEGVDISTEVQKTSDGTVVYAEVNKTASNVKIKFNGAITEGDYTLLMNRSN